MKTLLVTLSWLMVAVNLFGQQNTTTKPSCNCPSCIAKATGKTVPFTLPSLMELNAVDKHVTVTKSIPEVFASDEHAGCNHGDHEEDGHEEIEVNEHEGHDHGELEEDAHDAQHSEEHLGCNHEEGEDGHEGHDHSGHAQESVGIKISPEMAEKVGIKVNSASGGTISTSALFPAEIKLNRDQSSAVSARYPSIVRQVFVEIGDAVKKGDLLASLENRQTMAVYTVAAPLDGVVVSKSTSVGEAAGEDKVLFKVANLSTVWADISIFPRFQHLIRKGVAVEFIAHDGHVARGSIKYISPLVSEETRTFTARCVLKDALEDFTPGAFVRAKISIATTDVNVRIERDSVQIIDGEQIVFVPTENGFEARVVKTGVTDVHFVEVVSGLEQEEPYVATGAFSLKAEMITSGMDPHAGHGH